MNVYIIPMSIQMYSYVLEIKSVTVYHISLNTDFQNTK